MSDSTRSDAAPPVGNQAAFWHALRLAGWSTPIAGHGRLLREAWR